MPGVAPAPEHQAGLEALARGHAGARGVAGHPAWGMRLGREQREAERAQRAQEEERARQERR